MKRESFRPRGARVPAAAVGKDYSVEPFNCGKWMLAGGRRVWAAVTAPVGR